MFIMAVFYRLQLFCFAFALSAAFLVGAGMLGGMLDAAPSDVAQGPQLGSQPVSALTAP